MKAIYARNFSIHSTVMLCMAFGIMCISLVAPVVSAVSPKPEVDRTLLERYTKMLSALRADIARDLPTIDPTFVVAYQQAREAEKRALVVVNSAETNLSGIAKAAGLVNHAKGKWIGGADQGIAEAQAKLKKATTDADRTAAQQELATWQKNRAAGVAALAERQAAYDKAKREEATLKQALQEAQDSLAAARAKLAATIESVNPQSLLTSDKLDARLAKFVVLSEATPKGVAEFALHSPAHERLIEELLADDDLLLQMVLADGAEGGDYGRAISIYTDIQNSSDRAAGGVLQRLALATALAHAEPIQQPNAVAQPDAPTFVDPVKRYRHFEEAYLAGELDAGFNDLSVWDLRMVVNGEEPDEILAWGREMLHNYRPDHIATDDYRWRYVAAVRTDIKYGSQDNKFDQSQLQFFQNILMNGGVCGRRAFFGRFILRSFGVPTIARPQRGHAALAHWTPDGWVVCLGGGWGAGWAGPGRDSDLNFLATTQARATGQKYLQVKRAQWIGDFAGEKRTPGLVGGDPEFWNGIALHTQRRIIEESQAETLAPVGEELGESEEIPTANASEQVAVSDVDRDISIDNDGVITIPAAACSQPTKSTGKIVFMNSVLGGKQLHYGRNGGAQDFEYTFDVPNAGQYALTARVVTPSWKQHLLVSVNGSEKPIDIALPFTVGMWDVTEPVRVTLVEGKNVLRFSREEPVKGLTIKDFTLTPLAH